jgi:3'-phosphoadenosine 5'-phosphosulfate sulfotransferase (PAPS reductase)/FAD synthetase
MERFELKEYLLCMSGGNDSVALIQWAIDQGLSFDILYNDTGWAKDGWLERVNGIAHRTAPYGATVYRTISEGMEALVRRKKGWPMPASSMQFCTQALKEIPTKDFLEFHDPDYEVTCVNGVRREESRNRADAPEYVLESDKHAGRELWSPLVRVLEPERDLLIVKFGMVVLPHQSDECWPCTCANKQDLERLSSDVQRVDKIEVVEIDMGHTRNEKPRTMFRPYRVGGGVGIRQAVEWGCGHRGYKSTSIPEAYRFKGVASDSASDIAYDESTKEGREFSRQCDGGYCGS